MRICIIMKVKNVNFNYKIVDFVGIYDIIETMDLNKRVL